MPPEEGREQGASLGFYAPRRSRVVGLRLQGGRCEVRPLNQEKEIRKGEVTQDDVQTTGPSFCRNKAELEDLTDSA